MVDGAQMVQELLEDLLGQVPGVGTRVGEHLLGLVQALGDGQGVLGREPVPGVGLALQGGEVEGQGRLLGALAAFHLVGRALLAQALGRHGLGLLPVVHPGLAEVRGVVALGREPFGPLLSRLLEGRVHGPVVPGREVLYLPAAVHQQLEHRGLHPAHGD